MFLKIIRCGTDTFNTINKSFQGFLTGGRVFSVIVILGQPLLKGEIYLSQGGAGKSR